jgi:hypothetical protein
MSRQDPNPTCKHKLPLHNHACGGPKEQAKTKKEKKKLKKGDVLSHAAFGYAFQLQF